jgi:hypothetical protein
MGVRASLGAGNPLARAIGGSDAAVKRRCKFQHDERATGDAVMQIRGELCSYCVSFDTDDNVDAGGAQRGDALTGNLRVGVFNADDDTTHA